MRTTLLSNDPLFSRLIPYTVGMDRLMDQLHSYVDSENTAYPPYNIEQATDDHYIISVALAGFAKDDIEITKENGYLVIRGKQPEPDPDAVATTFLHKGIATRGFERTFKIMDDIEIVKAEMQDGLLRIELERVIPEEKKPLRIEIQ